MHFLGPHPNCTGRRHAVCKPSMGIGALIISYMIFWGVSLLYLYYQGSQNPILIIKAPKLANFSPQGNKIKADKEKVAAFRASIRRVLRVVVLSKFMSSRVGLRGTVT